MSFPRSHPLPGRSPGARSSPRAPRSPAPRRPREGALQSPRAAPSPATQARPTARGWEAPRAAPQSPLQCRAGAGGGRGRGRGAAGAAGRERGALFGRPLTSSLRRASVGRGALPAPRQARPPRVGQCAAAAVSRLVGRSPSSRPELSGAGTVTGTPRRRSLRPLHSGGGRAGGRGRGERGVDAGRRARASGVDVGDAGPAPRGRAAGTTAGFASVTLRGSEGLEGGRGVSCYPL